MRIYRGYKVELNINNKQRALFRECAGLARFAWNWGLERRIKEYRETGKSSSSFDQINQLNALKKTEFEWMYQYSRCIPQESLMNLGKAYTNFFRHIENKGKGRGFPKFKSKKKSPLRFCLRRCIHVKHDKIKVPRIGWLKLKEHGYIPVDRDKAILSVSISEKAGRWFISVRFMDWTDDRQPKGNPIGVDLGIKEMAVCSDGQRFTNPKPLRKARRRLSRVYRQLSRRNPGGKNWKKTKVKLAKLHWRVSNIRRDTLHKATSTITARAKPNDERPAKIAIENLNVRGIMKSRQFSYAMSDVGLAEFRRQIEYKAQWLGEEVIIADRFFPSSKLCRFCGCINDNLTLHDREWTCDCGAIHDRDLNAAINLRDLALRTEGSSETNAHRDGVRPVAVLQAASMKWEPSIGHCI